MFILFWYRDISNVHILFFANIFFQAQKNAILLFYLNLKSHSFLRL